MFFQKLGDSVCSTHHMLQFCAARQLKQMQPYTIHQHHQQFTNHKLQKTVWLNASPFKGNHVEFHLTAPFILATWQWKIDELSRGNGNLLGTFHWIQIVGRVKSESKGLPLPGKQTPSKEKFPTWKSNYCTFWGAATATKLMAIHWCENWEVSELQWEHFPGFFLKARASKL